MDVLMDGINPEEDDIERRVILERSFMNSQKEIILDGIDFGDIPELDEAGLPSFEEKEDPGAFVIPIRLEVKVYLNTLADTGKTHGSFERRANPGGSNHHYCKVSDSGYACGQITKTNVNTKGSDSEDDEDYRIKRNSLGASIYGPKRDNRVSLNDGIESHGERETPKCQDRASSGQKIEVKAFTFYRMETEEVSERYIAPCFVNGLEAYDGEINLEQDKNMISNELAVKLCLEHEVKDRDKELILDGIDFGDIPELDEAGLPSRSYKKGHWRSRSFEEKEDPGAFVIPIRLEVKVYLNTLADTAKTNVNTKGSDSEDDEDYCIKRNSLGASIYGPKSAKYMNYNDPMDYALALQE
nr:hypothetical protein [Tanacetum cinerariifolium]